MNALAKKTDLIEKMTQMASELSEQFPANAARSDGKTYRELIVEKLDYHTNEMQTRTLARPETIFQQFTNDLDTTRRVGMRKGIIG